MSKYFINRPINSSDINFINSLEDGSTIEFQNTKGLNKDLFRKIKTTIKIRIIGGLDEKEKPKFNTEKYYARTIYTPMEIYKIIDKMESIEKGIDPSWNDLEKAMYVYKVLCEGMRYDHIDMKENGRDLNRSLFGFITGKAVCAGFAMMYKEMMDRQGIRCLYQNKQYGHAWNLLEVNGKLVPVDLTWDNTENEQDNNRCDFLYFGRDRFFFNDPNHVVTDEKIYPTSLLTAQEFNEAYNKVVAKTNIDVKTINYVTPYGLKIDYVVIEDGKYKRCYLTDGRSIKTVIFDNTVSLNSILNHNLFSYDEYKFLFTRDERAKKEMHALNDNTKMFIREDGSKFIIQVDRTPRQGPILHKYVEMDNHKMRGYTLYSEDDLVHVPAGYVPGVANILLSKERTKEKATKFNGYVGYLGLENGRYVKYANVETEERIAGIKRY